MAKSLGLPLKMPRMNYLLRGQGDHIIDSNIQMLKGQGFSHPHAVRIALSHATKFGAPKLMKPKMPKI